MSLFNLSDDEVTLSELNKLIENEFCEKKIIDYKLKLELDGDENKKEFLADIISFANSDGGIIIYGVREETGIPVELSGIASADFDILKGRIENIIRDGIAPKLNTVIVIDVKISEERKALVIKVPKSWASPHLIWFKKSSKFFARNSSHGKYQLDVNEIRSSMLSSEFLYEKIRNFRYDRISKIINKNTPVVVDDDPKFVLHIIPLNSFYLKQNVDIAKFESLIFQPNPLKDYKMEYNFDGLLLHNRFDNRYPADQYIQIFRNSIIEVLNSNFTETKDDIKLIYGNRFESFYIENFPRWMDLIKFLGYNFPLIVFLSVLQIKGYSFNVKDEYSFRINLSPIINDNLLIQELFLEEHTTKNISFILKLLFDPIWNACGFPQSINYNANGNRITK